MSTSDTRATTLGPRAAFWVSAAVVAHTLWTSAAPAVTYPMYAAQWHLTPTVTTSIFAVYPIAVVAVLLLFGNLSDHIGRRLAMLFGLAASLIGVLCFAVASSVEWVFVGRVFMGIGVGLSASPSAAALVEFSAPGQSARASAIATAATALGLALAVLVGGALIQYAPYKMHLNFWVLAAVIALLFAATWFLPRQSRGKEATRWRPNAITVPKGIVLHFIASATAVTAAFALGALMLALGAQIARELIGSGNALVNGSALAFFAAVSGVVAIAGKRFAARSNIVAGGIAAAIGMALMMFAAKTQSLLVFLLAQGFDGAAYSLLFLGGLTLINLHAPAHQRGASISAIYLIGYLFMGLIALGIGMTATAFGLQTALDDGAPLIAVIGLAASALAGMKQRTRGLAGALG